jgi:hypothetical protein
MNRQFYYRFMVLVIALTLNGCAASTVQDVEESGFLDNYSQLSAGGEGHAVFLYVNPETNFKLYNKIMFDRVAVVLNNMEQYTVIDPAQLKELTDYFQQALFNAVKDGYEIVDQPGPGVLRTRFAITDVKPSKPVANTLSTILPVGWVVAGATKVASDENVGTGEAAAEMEIIDSLTGERLAAAVDRRQGGKKAFSGKWEDAKEAFEYWAKMFRQRLDEARGL